MTPEEEKDFAEKIVRLSYKCSEELGIKRDEVVSDIFINWLIDKIAEEEKPNEK